MSYRFSNLLAFLLATNANASIVIPDDAPGCSQEEKQAYTDESRINQKDYPMLESQVINAFAEPLGSAAQPLAKNALTVCGACAVSYSNSPAAYVKNLDKACYSAVNKFIEERNKGRSIRSQLLAFPENIPDRAPMTQEEQTNILGGASGAMGGEENFGR